MSLWEILARAVTKKPASDPQSSETRIDWKACALVEMVPGRLGGAPVIKDTRLPVDAILNNYDDGVEPEQVAELFEVPVSVVKTILEFREKQVARSTGS